MIRDHNIVCVASSWFDHPTSKHHVMRHLSADNHVLWVNYHASRRPQLNRSDARLMLRRLQQAWRGAQRVLPQVDVLSPLLVPWPESRVARRLNGWALHRQVQNALARLPRRPTQLWLFAPDIPELAERLPAERVVYYCVDDFAAFSGYNTALVEALERRTMARADLVVTTSAELLARCRGSHPAVHLVPHGVDYDHFAPTPRLSADVVPAELRGLPRPVLGYMGLVTDYVDLELLAEVARARPTWSIVLLGDIRCDVRLVAGLPNVHLLGGRPYADLPACCRGFDVGLIPFRMNRLIRAVNPIKLREYLAAGLPVVSAPLDAVRGYAPAVRLAQSPAEFLRACEAALSDPSPAAARQALVRAESWATRVAQLARLVRDLPPTPPDAEAGRRTPLEEAQVDAPAPLAGVG